MSEDAKTLMHWANAYRYTRIADYDNAYECSCTLKWAEYIIGAGC